MVKTVKVPVWDCKRCGHNWQGRSATKPKKCPSCTSPYWDKPRKQAFNHAQVAAILGMDKPAGKRKSK